MANDARIANRVKETTQTQGTGAYELLGAPPAHQTFVDAFSVTTTAETYYCCEDATQWEIGQGTITAGAVPTLSRDTVIASSDGATAIDWGPGTRDIFCTVPASKLLFKDEDGKIGRLTQSLPFLANGFTVSEVGFAVDSQIWTAARGQAVLSAKGSITIAGGLKLKWGVVAVGADSSVDDTFAAAFGTAFLAVVAYDSAKDNSTPAGRLSYTLTTTKITLHNGDTASANVAYLAIGT